jgi:hypothetical protein
MVVLAGAAVCLGIAPSLMPDSYSIVENAVSESAAQGVEGAWLARLGFLLLGFGVILLAQASAWWGMWGRLAFRVYGVSMICAAAFSHMPWEDVPYDRFEDFLHSVAAGAVGMSFIAGVLVVTVRRTPGRIGVRVFDAIAVAVALGISMTMFNVPAIAGALQRSMFAVAFVWFGVEAVRARNVGEETVTTRALEPIVPLGD